MEYDLTNRINNLIYEIERLRYEEPQATADELGDILQDIEQAQAEIVRLERLYY